MASMELDPVKVYTKLFVQDGPPTEKTTEQHPISRYLPSQMIDTFNLLYRRDPRTNASTITYNSWLVCPLYASDGGNKEGDIQIGVTGSMIKGEQYFRHGAIREISEEIGLEPMKSPGVEAVDNLRKVKSYRWRKKFKGTDIDYEMRTYYLRMGRAIPIPDHRHNKESKKGADDKRFKVGCFVFGTEKEVFTFLNQRIFHLETTDNIVGVAAIRASDVNKHIQMLARH